jgi:hypothetical protein
VAFDKPGLDPTASWYSGDAWYLFAIIMEKCGYPTAKLIFETCVKEGAAIEEANVKRASEVEKRAAAAPMKIPTIKQIDAADRDRICLWYSRLLTTSQSFTPKERKAVDRLQQRYIQLGGFPAAWSPKLPPIPAKRNHSDGVLLSMFDRNDPNSAFSLERARRSGMLTNAEYAASLVPQYGASGAHILRKLKYLKTGG